MFDVCAEPAVPGPLKDSVYQGSIVYPGPDVTLVFTTSQGRVQTYTATLTTSGVSHTVQAVQSGDQTVMFANLTEGKTYQVTIVATITRTDNSQNINSSVYSATFRVKPSSKSIEIQYNIIQLYCLCVEKFAFWLVIYIKPFNKINNKTSTTQ